VSALRTVATAAAWAAGVAAITVMAWMNIAWMGLRP